MVTFSLDATQWAIFKDYFEKTPRGVFTNEIAGPTTQGMHYTNVCERWPCDCTTLIEVPFVSSET